MAKPVTKAMVLCAGLGTRLHPITHQIPKPLVQILNIPNVLHIFQMLKNAGIKDVIINLFHLPEHMESFLKQGRCIDMNVSYSKESPLLGTGGGVKKAELFLKGGPFVLANCDFVTNIKLNAIIERHQQRKATASMVLIGDPIRQHLYSKVGVDAEGHLCSLPKLETKPPVKTGIFTGIHILEDGVLAHLQDRPSGINEELYPYLMKEQPTSVYADFETKGYWYDTGDVSALWFASMELLKLLVKKDLFISEVLINFGFHYQEVKPGIWMEPGVEFPRHATIIGPVVIGKNVSAGHGSTIGPFAVIGDHSHIGKKVTVSNCVLLNHSVIPDSHQIKDCLHYQKEILPAKSLV